MYFLGPSDGPNAWNFHGEATNFRGAMSNFRGAMSNFHGAMSNFHGEASNFRGEATNFCGEATGGNQWPLHKQHKLLCLQHEKLPLSAGGALEKVSL